MRQKDRIRLTQIIEQFKGKKVLVIGDLMLDEYIWGKVRRISPEAPVPVVEAYEKTYMAGGAGNSASNIASLGGVATLTGLIGKDTQGEYFCEKLTELGIDTSHLLTESSLPTITKTRVIANKQHIVRVDVEKRDPLSPQLEEQLLGKILNLIRDSEVVVISDYGKQIVSKNLAQTVIREARSAGIPVIIDPKGNQYEKYRGGTIITPNVMEAEQALRCEIRNEEDIFKAGDAMNSLIEGEAVLLTRGAEGMTLFRRNGDPVTVPAVARNLFDVTGAGDTVVATLAMCMACNADLEDAVYLANLAAGLVVEKLGTATVTGKELHDAL